ncbi:AAA-4 family protein [Rhizobium sp. PDO1-076]|uniref:AlbA family DNA-binding domain-containing protein n=1 Tax=Rhizobium sp. PDO1-076 TaxID=1125979 RepID=UPI00024E3CE2|nr:ATP-binding protein [Rhizobium sp. PDO1-076]EHS50680.1 AAA-4 family protein [Rhizobium sp. PDO1-076]
MSVLTDIEQMEQDLRHRSEQLHVEFKAWMDISKQNRDGQNKIARHVAAIANHGGGRLYFGVDDDGRAMPPSSNLGLDHYKSDAIHNLLKTRLEPPIQCEVRITEYTNGVAYPVVHVPSHGPMPIAARDENSFFQIYVRSVGPESRRIETPIQWEKLLKRCFRQREAEAVQEAEEDYLSRTQSMTKAITEAVVDAVLKVLSGHGAPGSKSANSEPDWELIDLLAEATRQDFIGQIKALPSGHSESDQQISTIAQNHVSMGYALLADDFSPITLENPHRLLRQTSNKMQEMAHFGWHHFIVLTNSDAAPRSRFWQIDGREFTGVEGMRIDGKGIYFGSFDYWRAYGSSVFVICESYREDYNRLRRGTDHPFLTSTQIFMRLHSLLVHAWLTVEQVPSAANIALFTDHRGLDGRILGRGFDYGLRVHSGVQAAADRFPTRLVVSRSELLENYFGTLKRLSVQFLELWAGTGAFDPDEWFNKSNIDQIVSALSKESSNVALPP